MSSTASNVRDDAICPFCALLCDDIVARSDSTGHPFDARGCGIANSRYSGIVTPMDEKCHIFGNPATHPEAIRTAAELVSKSEAMVITGMYTDVAGSRAALKLAERKSAVIMSADGSAAHSQASRIQRSGGYLTTLSEIRNRADLIVMFGHGPIADCPRIPNMLRPPHRDDHPCARSTSLVMIGTGNGETPEGSISFECTPERFGMLADAVSLGVQGKRHNHRLGFISNEQIDRLTDMITDAEYPVVIWAESDFDFPLGDLALDSINQLIQSVNVNGRCSGLVVSRSACEPTVNQVATWQFGKPLPLSFRTGRPDYFPAYHSFRSLEKRHDVDLIVWVGGLEVQPQIPESKADAIVISHSRPTRSQLFIPIGIPGVHHDGHLFRTDQVVAMHIQRTVCSVLPSAEAILTSILAKLDSPQC
ncbi:MAG: hypothetical protein OXI60_05705 [Acidiferrobacterales bacterium]|nr:hypothetical protein [Acidiferrobacterales bacterium]